MPRPPERPGPGAVAGLTVAGLLIAASCAAAVSIRSYDFGWHLRAGEEILAAGGRPPDVDTLSSTAHGQAWVDHEWLFQAALAATVRRGGLAAAWGLKHVAAWVVVLLPAAWLLARRTPPWAVASLIVLALEGARFRLAVRPELVGLALLPVLLLLLDRARRATGRGVVAWLAAVPLLIVFWVNVHPSALLAAALTGVFAVVVALQERGRGERAVVFLLTAFLAGVCLLANPYGAEVLTVPLRIRSALAIEGLANPEWGHALQQPFWLFWLLVPLLSVLLVRAARHGIRIDWPMLAVGALLALGGALALRLLGFFYVALPWVAARAVPSSPVRQRGMSRTAALALPVLAGIGFLLAPRPGGAGIGPELSPGRFPEAMARSYMEYRVQGPLYNPVRFGGYLSWALSGVPVFIDGRNELHGPLLAEIADCRRRVDVACWDALLDRWNVEAAMVEYDARRLPDRFPDGRIITRSAASVWFRRSRWALIDWDDTAMLYVRRAGVNAELAARHEDRWLTPDDAEGFFRRLAAGRIDPGAARQELRRHGARHPQSRRARLLESLLDGHPVGEPVGGENTEPPGSDRERPSD